MHDPATGAKVLDDVRLRDSGAVGETRAEDRPDISFQADFDLTGVAAQAPQGASLDWSRAEFLIGASDPRGAQSDISLQAAGQTLPLAPATSVSDTGLQTDTNFGRITGVRGNTNRIVQLGLRFRF